MADTIQIQIVQGPLCNRTPHHTFGAGAIICFDGIIRPTENAEPIAGLTYEVYEPMASQKLRELAQKAKQQFDLLAVDVQHSEGFVPIGESSFRLVVAARHRGEALAAMAWFIDTMKQDVPIWKTPVATKTGDAAL